MKPIVWVRHIKISTSSDAAGPPGEGTERIRVARLSLADKAAIAVLAVGLLALGGVLLAAGLALLLALVAGGVALGAVAVARHRLFGPRAPRLAPGEVAATAVILPAEAPQAAPDAAPPILPPGSAAPRGD